MNRMIVVASMAAILATGTCFAESGSGGTEMNKAPAVHHTEKTKHKAHHATHHKAKHHDKIAKAEKSKEKEAKAGKKEQSAGDADK